MNKYPITADNGDLLGYVSLDKEAQEAFENHFREPSIVPVVLLGNHPYSADEKQLIAFELRVEPACGS